MWSGGGVRQGGSGGEQDFSTYMTASQGPRLLVMQSLFSLCKGTFLGFFNHEESAVSYS